MIWRPDVHEVAAALRVSIGLLVRRLRQVPAAGELTMPETSALARLDRGGPATSGALAKQEQISPQSMGATLAALEARGLVERGPDPDDGRRVVLTITDAGRQVLRDKRNARTEQLARALPPGSPRRAGPADSGRAAARAAGPEHLMTKLQTARTRGQRRPDDRYKWIALSNTTAAVFMSALDGSIVIIALPAIFRGIDLDPLAPGNIGYLLWMIMGYRLVQAVLVVTLGRLGDMFGRVRIYNAGFVVFTVASILLSFDPFTAATGRCG